MKNIRCTSFSLLLVTVISFLISAPPQANASGRTPIPKNVQNTKPKRGLASIAGRIQETRKSYLNKCTKKGGNNFFRTCLGVQPNQCGKEVSRITKSARKLLEESSSLNIKEAFRRSALKRVPKEKKKWKTCIRKP